MASLLPRHLESPVRCPGRPLRIVRCGGRVRQRAADAGPALAAPPGADRTIELAEEVAQGGRDQVWCFFWQEVAGGQFVAAGVGGVLLPDMQRLIAAADEPLRSP